VRHQPEKQAFHRFQYKKVTDTKIDVPAELFFGLMMNASGNAERAGKALAKQAKAKAEKWIMDIGEITTSQTREMNVVECDEFQMHSVIKHMSQPTLYVKIRFPGIDIIQYGLVDTGA
jgi:hypothetical protein